MKELRGMQQARSHAIAPVSPTREHGFSDGMYASVFIRIPISIPQRSAACRHISAAYRAAQVQGRVLAAHPASS